MITEHAVCALPADHPDWRYLVLRIKRRGSTDRWLITWGAYYWDGGDWHPSMGNAVEYDEERALHLAGQLTVQVDVNGLTAADLISRANA